MKIHRRGFIAGFASLIAAPAIVRVVNIMPVKVIGMDFGRSPALLVRTDFLTLEEYAKQILSTIDVDKLYFDEIAFHPSMKTTLRVSGLSA